jgi:hypothetical protein
MWQAADGHEDALSWAVGVTTLPDPLSVAGVQQKAGRAPEAQAHPGKRPGGLPQVDRPQLCGHVRQRRLAEGRRPIRQGLETLSQPFSRSKA